MNNGASTALVFAEVTGLNPVEALICCQASFSPIVEIGGLMVRIVTLLVSILCEK